MRVARWLNNFENRDFEVHEENIDLIEELEQEETAALALIQDDALEEQNNLNIEKEALDSLIATINTEVTELKKTLKF